MLPKSLLLVKSNSFRHLPFFSPNLDYPMRNYLNYFFNKVSNVA